MKMKAKLHFLRGKPFFTLLLVVALTVQGLAQDCSGLSFSCTTTESECVSTGSITVTVSGGVGPFNFRVEGPTNKSYTSSNVITGLRPGAYKVFVQDVGNSGCVVEQSNIIVAGSYTDPNFFLSKTDVTCDGDDGEIHLASVTGGRPPFTYTIMPLSASGVGASNATGSFTNLIPGDYHIQLEDACGNLQTRTVTILNFSWSFDKVTVTRVGCDSADAFIHLKDNKGNTNSSGTAFNGFQYGMVNSPGDTVWSTSPNFRFFLNNRRSVTFVAKDPCGTLISYNWSVPNNERPSLDVPTSDEFACTTFTVLAAGMQNLTNPQFCLYNSSNEVVACNSTGIFKFIPYGSYCLKTTDICYDTTITQCFTVAKPVPNVGATVAISNQTCTVFTATITGQTNLINPQYCLYDNTNTLVSCNTTGVFDNVPYGSYCIKITDGCTGAVIDRCFVASPPEPVVNSVRIVSQTCNAIVVDVDGQTNVPSTQYCLYDNNGNLIMCNSTGVFENIPHGNYCIRARSECGVLSEPYCFGTTAPTPSVGDVTISNKACRTFTASITGQSNLSNPQYCLFNNSNVQVACNTTGVFNNLEYGSYCIRITDGCVDTTISRCFSAAPEPVSVATTMQTSDLNCSTFTATVSATNVTNPVYCLYNTSNDLVGCNATGVFSDLPYGAYCATVYDSCLDSTFRVCQTVQPARGISLWTYKTCNIEQAHVDAQLKSRFGPYTFTMYHPDGTQVYTQTTWSDWVRAELPALPPGAKYKVVGVDNCGQKDSSYIAPDATIVTRAITVNLKCPSMTWSDGSGDFTITYNSNLYELTPMIIKKDNVEVSQSYSVRDGYNKYTFVNLGPGTYVVQGTMSQCNTKINDTIIIRPYTPPTQNSSAIYQCDNNGFSVNSIVGNGVGPFTYEIIGSTPSSPSIITGPQSSPFFTINNGTEYSLVRLRAVDACGNAALDDASVLPLGSLVISRTSNCLYREVTLSVDEIPNASYQWYKKTSEVDSVLIGTGHTYTIPYMLESDIATYVCKTSVNGTCLTKLSSINMTGDCGGTVLAVPVQLHGKKTSKGNLLTWNIDLNETGAVYTVERKADGENNFKMIASGGYTLEAANKYSFVDAKPATGSNLYRVNKTLPSGAVEYSNTEAMVNTTLSIEVFPNPVRESFTVVIYNKVATNYSLALYTMDGRLVFQKQLVGITDASLIYPTPAGLKAGTYVLRITNPLTGASENRKLLFQ